MDDISFSRIEHIFRQYSQMPGANNGSRISSLGFSYSPLDDVLFMSLIHAQWIHVPLIIVTNVLVIAATYFIKNLQTTDNLIIGGLAIMDLMTGIVSIPILWMFFQIDGTAEMLGGSRIPCYISLLMPAIFPKTSLSILILMTLDRFVAIKYPFVYSQHSSKKKVKLAITILFFLTVLKMSIAVSFPDGAWTELTEQLPNQSFSDEQIRKHNRWCQCVHKCRLSGVYRKYEHYLIWGQIGIGFFMTLNVACVAWKQHNAIILVMEIYNTEDLKKHRNQIKVTLLLMFMYIILWLPTSIIEILHDNNSDASDETVTLMYIIAKHCQFLNAWANAFVYALFKSSNSSAYYFLITNCPWNWGNIKLRRKSRLVEVHQERMALKRMAMRDLKIEVPTVPTGPTKNQIMPDFTNFVKFDHLAVAARWVSKIRA